MGVNMIFSEFTTKTQVTGIQHHFTNKEEHPSMIYSTLLHFFLAVEITLLNRDIIYKRLEIINDPFSIAMVNYRRGIVMIYVVIGSIHGIFLGDNQFDMILGKF